MMFATPCEDYKPNPVLARALDRILSFMPTTSKTPLLRPYAWQVFGANPFACIAAGIACLWGASHGGANEAVLKMLDEIGDVSNVAAYMEGVKQRKYRLMGFGSPRIPHMDPTSQHHARNLL